jgi:uncharacterized OB-fold protein
MESKSIPKPAPTPTDLTRPFWDAAREHRLVIQRCEACGRYIHWPQLCCPACASEALGWAQVSGRGIVYAFTVVQHVFHPGFTNDMPYSLALVELEEQPGLRLLANIVECENDALRTGMPVEVTFEDRDGYTLPQFRPAGASR